MSKLKGQTTVVATVLIIGMTVAAAGSVYVYTSGTVEKGTDKKQIPFKIAKVSFETCYKQSGKVHISLRNSNDYAINTSKMNFYVNKKVVKKSNYQINPKIVETKSSFTIQTSKNIASTSQLKIAGPEDSKKFRCLDLAQPTPVSNPQTQLEAKFSYSPGTPEKNQQVNFFDNSDGPNINSYSWDFGDGSTSTNQNPQHTYTSTGTYNVQLTVENTTGHTDSKTKTITVISPTTIVAVPEGGGNVSSIIKTTSVKPHGSSLCIGNQCSHLTGQGATNTGTLSDTDDTFVDLSGDNMTGSLNTTKITTSGTLCIGNQCSTTQGSKTGYLNDTYNEMDGTLLTPSIYTDNNLCLGSSC